MNTACAGKVCRPLLAFLPLLLTACGDGGRPADSQPSTVENIVVVTTVTGPGIVQLIESRAQQIGVTAVVNQRELQTFQDAANAGSTADLLIAGDLENLVWAAEQNLFRPTRSTLISERIPAVLRDPDHMWTALGMRVRAVFFNPELVSDSDIESLTSFASLADTHWRDKLCLASSSLAGNRSLVARLMRNLGERQAEIVVRGWRSNLTQPIFPNDPILLREISAGTCAIGIADSAEFLRLLQADKDALVVQHWFPDATEMHVEISGGGVTRHARYPEHAVAMLELLTGVEANARFAEEQFEYSVNPDAPANVAPDARLRTSLQSANVAELGFLLQDAIRLTDRARYP